MARGRGRPAARLQPGLAGTRPAASRWLDDAGRPELDLPVELWITCRMTHVFALGHLLGRPGCGALVDHGLAGADGAVPGRRSRRLVRRGRPPTARPAARRAPTRTRSWCWRRRAPPAPAGPAPPSCWTRRSTCCSTRFWDDEHGMVVEEWDESFDRARRLPRRQRQHAHGRGAARGGGRHRRPGLLDRALRVVEPCRARPRAAPPMAASGALRRAWQPLLDYNGDQPRASLPPLRRHDRPLAGVGPAGAAPAGRARCLGPGLAARGRGGSLRRRRCARAGRSTARTASSTPSTGRAGRSSASGCTGSPPRRPRPPRRCTRRPATRRTRSGTRPGGTTSPRCSSTESRVRGTTSSTRGTDPAAWSGRGKPDTYHALQATLIPRLPLTPALAAALRDGLLR